MKRKGRLCLLLAISILATALFGCSVHGPSETLTTSTEVTEKTEKVIYNGEANVFWMYPSGTTPRQSQFDIPLVTKYLKIYAPNINLILRDAENNEYNQLQQVEAAISSGCDFMIYEPAKEESAAGALHLLNEEKIPFCSMVLTPFGGNCPLLVTMPFDSIAESYIEYMEKEILTKDIGRPYRVALLWLVSGSNFYNVLKETYHNTLDRWEDEGKIEIIFEGDSTSYLASDMKILTEQMLTQCQNNVDVCITMNDEGGTGIVAALEEQGIINDVVLLGGCDATVDGIARTMEGWQAGDVLPDYEKMAESVAKIVATYLSEGEYPMDMATGRTANGFMNGGIPSVMVKHIFVTKDNVQEEIFDKGVLSREEVEAAAITLK